MVEYKKENLVEILFEVWTAVSIKVSERKNVIVIITLDIYTAL